MELQGKKEQAVVPVFFFFFKLLHYHIVHVLINALGS